MPVIYKITSPSNKVYIGQSWDWSKRKSVYKRVACPKQLYLFNSLVKYGYEKHKLEILINLPDTTTQEELDKLEIFYWQKHKDERVNLLNIREPGKGGKNSEETRLKMSNSLKGRVISQESINKRLVTLQRNNYKPSEETCTKIGLGHKNKIISSETREKISKTLTGRKLSNDTITKRSNSRIYNNLEVSEETKRKIGIAVTGNKNGMYGKVGELCSTSKKIIDTSTNQIFESIKSAAEYYNMKDYNLSFKLRGICKNNTNLKYLINV